MTTLCRLLELMDFPNDLEYPNDCFFPQVDAKHA